MTVDQLRERLAEFPGYYPVVVEVIVGGDLVTDDVDLDDVKAAGFDAPYVRLLPDPADNYDTRNLIDDGLEARALAERRATAAAQVRT